jgi:hypothetical protein
MSSINNLAVFYNRSQLLYNHGSSGSRSSAYYSTPPEAHLSCSKIEDDVAAKEHERATLHAASVSPKNTSLLRTCEPPKESST